MIYTITTNPSLDYYLTFDKPIIDGEHNRSTNENFDAGGKGVNVSIFLNSLGIQSACLGFLGGFTKDYYLQKLTKYTNIQPLFTSIKENTRINIKTLGYSDTSLNALGPHISDEEYDKFIKRATRIYDTDYIVLSGTVQDELNEKMISMIEDLSNNGTRVILDTDTDLTEMCLKYKPYAVKLNDLNSGLEEKEIIEKARDYIEKGANYVLYSSPNNTNYYLVYEGGAYKASRKELAIGIGSGDSMIAGLLYSLIHGANALEAFKYAATCSMLLRLSNDTFDRGLLEQAVDGLEVTSL